MLAMRAMGARGLASATPRLTLRRAAVQQVPRRKFGGDAMPEYGNLDVSSGSYLRAVRRWRPWAWALGRGRGAGALPPTCTGLLMAQYLCVRWSPQLHRPALINSRVGKVFATTMWFWIMFRGYHDLPHMLVRFRTCPRTCPRG